MEVHELPPGAQAPEDSDRVTLNLLPSGKTGFSGVCRQGEVTVHFIHQNDFDTESEALEGAAQWAEERGISFLYVERPNA